MYLGGISWFIVNESDYPAIVLFESVFVRNKGSTSAEDALSEFMIIQHDRIFEPVLFLVHTGINCTLMTLLWSRERWQDQSGEKPLFTKETPVLGWSRYNLARPPYLGMPELIPITYQNRYRERFTKETCKFRGRWYSVVTWDWACWGIYNLGVSISVFKACEVTVDCREVHWIFCPCKISFLSFSGFHV